MWRSPGSDRPCCWKYSARASEARRVDQEVLGLELAEPARLPLDVGDDRDVLRGARGEQEIGRRARARGAAVGVDRPADRGEALADIARVPQMISHRHRRPEELVDRGALDDDGLARRAGGAGLLDRLVVGRHVPAEEVGSRRLDVAPAQRGKLLQSRRGGEVPCGEPRLAQPASELGRVPGRVLRENGELTMLVADDVVGIHPLRGVEPADERRQRGGGPVRDRRPDDPGDIAAERRGEARTRDHRGAASAPTARSAMKSEVKSSNLLPAVL